MNKLLKIRDIEVVRTPKTKRFKYFLVETANGKKHKLRIDDEFMLTTYPSTSTDNLSIKLSLYKYNEGDIIISKTDNKRIPFKYLRISEMEEGFFYKIERNKQ